MVDYYLFRLALEWAVDDGAPSWPYLFDRIDGFSWNRETAFDVIIGMDLLLQCDVTLTRGGECVLTFG